MGSSFLRLAALAGGHDAWPGADAAAATAAATAAAGHRLLLEQGGNGLSEGMVVLYIITSVVLVAVSGLMAGLVLGLLSLDRMDLAVLKRTGSEQQKWLVGRVEPLTRDPHFTMCALVVVNAACNTALPLFIDRLLNPLAALLISVTAILIFAEIAPQAVCKRYGLEIGAYCSWLVRGLRVLTAPVAWPLAKLLDLLLGEESVLFRRQELNALISLHAEPQQDGSVGALTTDEAQVIKGALDMASKTAEAVMTPLAKVFMLSSEAVIDSQLLATVLAAGHSRVPVHEGENRQAILGLILVKELLVVDEAAGMRVRDLRLREMPFLCADIPLYDVLKIFRFGRKHMACLTRVSREASTRGIIGGSPAANGSTDGGLVRRASPALPGAFVEGQQVEEVVGIVTIEDVLEELLQAEIVDETDRFEDNLQTVPVPSLPQKSMKELPPHLRRFLSPRRSMHGAKMDADRAAIEVARLSPVSAASSATGDTIASVPAPQHGPGPEQAGPGSPMQRQGSGLGRRSVSTSSLGAAAAASVLVATVGPAGGGAEAMAAAVAAGVRAAELNAASHAGQAQPASRPGSRLASGTLPDSAAGGTPAHSRAGSGLPPLPPRGSSTGGASHQHVTLELGDLHARHTTTSSEGSPREEEEQRHPLVNRRSRQQGAS